MSISTDLAPGAGIMAHNIIFEGQSHRLAIARHLHDGSLNIAPFTGEVHTTEFINGTVLIEKTAGGYKITPQKPCDIEAQLL